VKGRGKGRVDPGSEPKKDRGMSGKRKNREIQTTNRREKIISLNTIHARERRAQ